MKQKMKYLVSYAALLLMMISMLSVWVLPATADEASDEYESMLNSALIVDPSWADKKDGDAITFNFRGKEYKGRFNSNYYFASYSDAMARAEALGLSSPVILLCAGTYTETITITSAVTLLGPNAGMDPNVKTSEKDQAWSLSTERGSEAIVKSNVIVKKSTGNSDITIDGLRFERGGALLDYTRTTGASTIAIKNTVFWSSGNEDEAHQFTLYLRSSGHARTLELENLYITGLNFTKASGYEVGFISPFFVDLKADNIAFVNNKNGFISQSWFAQAASPVVDISNSCFFNTNSGTAGGYVISMDNQSYDYDFSSSKDLTIATSNDRPASTLTLTGNIFYNATSSTKKGVIHYEFINARTLIEAQNNYFYTDDQNGNQGKSFLDPEYIYSTTVDYSDCIVVKNNVLIGAYKVPSLAGSMTIDMSYNYFATTTGVIVTAPVYTDLQQLIREDIWIDEELTEGQGEWILEINDWELSWVDTLNFSASIILYDEVNIADAPISFSSGEGRTVQLYTGANITGDGIITSVDARTAIPDNKLDESILGVEPGTLKTIYAQITDEENPNFAPVYTVTIENMGTISDAQSFSEAYPEYYLYKPELEGLRQGTLMPYLWQGGLYRFEVGVNAFPSVEEIINHAETQGIYCPTIVIPAGLYEEELLITGSCIILGEKHGINPNVKPVEILTKENFSESPWKLNPERSESGTNETRFNNAIRVVEGADNYTVTIDGILMLDGCSYVDDEERTGETTTIFKNILVVNGGGAPDRNGTKSSVFNFNKAYSSSSTDRCYMYMYDTRIVGLNGKTCFGPYYEKFVLDGVYYGNAINTSYFINNIASRDIPDPYYSITNCYFYNSNSVNMSGFYAIRTNDPVGTLSAKTNIVYNLDNNVFNEFFPKNYGAFEIQFTGNNMTFSFTNNTLVNGDSDTIFATTYGASRFKGNCSSQNVSDMLIVKGNRLIGKNRLPMTNGTGVGTMLDFSGNYFAGSVNTAALSPDGAWRTGASKPGDNGYTYEEATRVKIDYTFMDWDMTVRSDESSVVEAEFEATTGQYGTGVYKEEELPGGAVEYSYTDHVPADCEVYENPIVPGEYSTVKLYSNATLTDEISEMTLTGASNTFYCVVSSTDNTVQKIIPITITRALNTENELYYMSGSIVDDENATITTYVNFDEVKTYYFRDMIYAASNGAEVAYYEDEACTESTTRVRLYRGETTAYVKVSSEDGSASKVYTLNFVDSNTIDPAQFTNAEITYVDGMEKGAGNTFETTITLADPSLTFKPYAYYGGTCEVYNGDTKLTPDNNGYYTVANTGSETQILTAVVTSGSGDVQQSYTLKINKEKSNACEILAIEGAQQTAGGFLWNMGLANASVLKATVSPGATYEVYQEYTCENIYEDGFVIAMDGSEIKDTFNVYVKVTADDGTTSKVHKVLAMTQAGNRTMPVVTGEVNGTTYTALMTGKNEYSLYLPAEVESVTVAGKYTIKLADGSDINIAEYSVFANSGKTVAVGSAISLDQKITTLYLSTGGGQYNITAEDGTVDYTVVPASDVVLKIYSDRKAVSYSDADKVNKHWVKEWVDYLNTNHYGIFQGDENGKINVESKITRYEIATIAARVMGLDVTKYSGVTGDAVTFADTIDPWAQPYVYAVAVNGVMNGHLEGVGLIFDGNAYATREEVIKVLVSACMISEGVTTMDGASYYAANKATVDYAYSDFTFADEDKVSDWAVPFMRLAVGKYNLIGGSAESDGKLYLNPGVDITRAEVAKIVAAYYGYEA